MILTAIVAILAFFVGACIVAIVWNSKLSAARTQLATTAIELDTARNLASTMQTKLGEREDELRSTKETLTSNVAEAMRLNEELRQKEQSFARQNEMERQAHEQRLEQMEFNCSQRIAQQERNFTVQMSEQKNNFEQQMQQQQRQAEEKLALLVQARQELSDQFKAIGAEILDLQSRKFTEQNEKNLTQVLNPLGERIQAFQKKVEEVYVQEGKDRTALGEQVKMLMQLNQQLSQDTSNLTRALTTQSKAQGDLGEMILEKILEASGLRKDEEYVVQSSFRNQEGGQSRPDVIVHLPEDKHLIIDSKVSLTAYNEYVNAASEEARQQALARHVDSVRRHVKELAEKDYQSLHQLNSIDFVCMFVPIEGAFLAAVANDPELSSSSFNRGVLLMSPSTLLFVVRTVAHLWRQERQKQNVQDVVNRGAELYDKLRLFVEEMQQLGERLEQAQKSYGGAMNKLSRGRGNVIRQAEMLIELGVKPKADKRLPAELVEASEDETPLLTDTVTKL